jgi:hypothetical protein
MHVTNPKILFGLLYTENELKSGEFGKASAEDLKQRNLNKLCDADAIKN